MFGTGILALLTFGAAAGEFADEDPGLEVARMLSNPFADIYTIPINQNPDFGIGADDRGWRYVLTLQPVLPIRLTEEWNIISRTVLPVISQDVSGESDFGLADTTE